MKAIQNIGFLLLMLCTACASQPQAPAPASNQAAVQEACKDPHVQCSDQAIPIALHFSDGHGFKQTLQPPIPLVQYDHVYLYPGQALYVEADEVDGKLVNLRVVPAMVHPEKTLILGLQQNGGNGGEGMMFSIQQPFDRPLKYRAQVMDFDSPGAFKQTSTCPVIAKGGGYETWPEPITQMMVGEFHFVDASSPDAGACSY